MTSGKRAPGWQRNVVAAGCIYELAALWSDLPTITNLAHRYPVVAGALVGGLSIHFHPERSLT